MFFKRHFTLTCCRSQDEVMGSLRSACKCRSREGNSATFTGRMHHFGFVLWRHVDRYNVFAPRVCGSFRQTDAGKCEVELTMRLHRMHRWLMFSVYLCWAGGLVTLLAVTRHLEFIWIVALIPIPLLVLGCMAFRTDAQRRARKITRMMRGQLQIPGQRN